MANGFLNQRDAGPLSLGKRLGMEAGSLGDEDICGRNYLRVRRIVDYSDAKDFSTKNG
jgi:hypothetical protein